MNKSINMALSQSLLSRIKQLDIMGGVNVKKITSLPWQVIHYVIIPYQTNRFDTYLSKAREKISE